MEGPKVYIYDIMLPTRNCVASLCPIDIDYAVINTSFLFSSQAQYVVTINAVSFFTNCSVHKSQATLPTVPFFQGELN